MHLDSTYTLQHPALITSPLSLLISIYLTTIADNHPDIPHLTPFSTPTPPDYIIPSVAR
jgi:hypothetical protein